MNLHPTPTRLALLRDVADGLVMEDPATEVIWRDDRLGGFYDPNTATCTRVTAKVRELENAGWVELGNLATYRLTETGKRILAETEQHQ